MFARIALISAIALTFAACKEAEEVANDTAAAVDTAAAAVAPAAEPAPAEAAPAAEAAPETAA